MEKERAADLEKQVRATWLLRPAKCRCPVLRGNGLLLLFCLGGGCSCRLGHRLDCVPIGCFQPPNLRLEFADLQLLLLNLALLLFYRFHEQRREPRPVRSDVLHVSG